MSGHRIATKGAAFTFTFDGRTVEAFPGDTIASALIANGISIVGRSFKYHRPRGFWGAGVEEPNGIVDIAGQDGIVNARATTTPARPGMVVRSVNAGPDAASDRNRFIDLFARFIPSGFYYKTFMFPDWHLFEPRIREMVGLGRLDPAAKAPPAGDQVNHWCDLIVVGAGPSGLSAALLAAEAGENVMLVDDQREAGGSLLHRNAEIDGIDGKAWLSRTLTRLTDLGATILTGTTAFGLYDHLLVGLHQDLEGGASRLWRVRPKRVVLATGAIERPLPFANNDLPGILSAEAALVYLRRHGVAVGKTVVLATNNSHAYAVADALAAAGVGVTIVDSRQGSTETAIGCRILRGTVIEKAEGKGRVERVHLANGEVVAADAVLVSGGLTASIHLYAQAKGKLDWREDIATFVPGTAIDNLSVIGAAKGSFTLAEALDDARALHGTDFAGPRATGSSPAYSITPTWPKPNMKGRVWIDLQNDVTTKDVELAARENFVSVEHLKRYTTLGMATDQGKTSNLNGLALMAAATGRALPDVGTTTYRPPFTPVPFAALAGHRGGELFNPVLRLPLENLHRAAGAVFQEYGGWLRPAWYGAGPREERIRAEVLNARESATLFDGSPLGKIEVIGPQAAEFLDFVYYNTVSTLKPGRCRYGFILTEGGVVYDDGVLLRLDENRFVVSCSSSHVAGMHALLEEWRQDRFDRKRVFIHNATAARATMTVSGPASRKILEAAGLELPLDDESLPHMATAPGRLNGIAVQVSRVSFTGDRSYEITAPADRAADLWTHLKEAGKPFGMGPMGSEALLILRAEKGYLIIGKDTDGMTRPMDLGLTAPLERKTAEFIGKRSLLMEVAQGADRQQFVGLEVVDGGPPLATGAHGVETGAQGKRSIGYVTSSYMSPTLNRPIALGLIERGLSRMGETITVQHLGQTRPARIVSPCALDPKGDRLNA